MSSGHQSGKGWDEEMLLAYADDELDPKQAAAVEELLRGDPEAQAVLALLRRSATAVRHAFDAPLSEPVPERLTALLEQPVAAARSRRPAFALSHVMLPLAASILTLVLGFGGGYLFRDEEAMVAPASTADSDPGEERFASALRRALDQGAGGEAIAYEVPETGARGSVVIVGPVDSGLGIPCQAFRHEAAQNGAVSRSVGVACRQADGAWSILSVPAPAS
jgi:anti-sigma factor RsiW